MYGSIQPAYLDKPMVLAGVLPDSTAQKAGLQAGDHVIKINSKSNPTWDEARLELLPSLPGHPLSSMVVERNGQEISLSFLRDNRSMTFTVSAGSPGVGSVSSGMPAERVD